MADILFNESSDVAVVTMSVAELMGLRLVLGGLKKQARKDAFLTCAGKSGERLGISTEALEQHADQAVETISDFLTAAREDVDLTVRRTLSILTGVEAISDGWLDEG